MNTKTEKAVILIFSFLAAMMPFLNIGSIEGEITGHAVVDMFISVNRALKGKSLVMTILLCALYCLGVRRYDRDMPRRAVFMVFSFLVSLVWLAAESFRIDDTLGYLTANTGQILKSLIYVMGAAYLIFEILAAFCHLMALEDGNILRTEGSGEIRAAGPFLRTFVGILAVWALPVYVCYPGYMCNDSWTQMLQYWGYNDFTSHHPPVHTVLLGLFSRAGKALGSMNGGLYAFVLFQTIIFAAVLAYTYILMIRMQTPAWLMTLFLLLALFAPHFQNYACTIIKDSLYSIMVLLFVDELICAIRDPGDFISGKRHWILSFFSILGTALFRNNGKHILYPTLALAAVFVLIKRKELGKSVVVRILVLILVSVTFAGILEKGVIRVHDIEPGSIGEALSFPFQQTARTVVEHGDEITQEEKEAIDAVLDYNSLAENYKPHLSDPVKATIRKDADSKALIRYLVTWFRMFFKYPAAYVKATVNQNYLLVYPREENRALYDATLNYEPGRDELMVTVLKETGVSEGTRNPVLKDLIYNLQSILYSLPAAGLLLHHASYVIILLASIILAIQKKLYRYLIISLPGLLSVVVIILAPVIKRHPRYSFPIMYTLPVMLAYFIFLLHDRRTIDSGN